MSYDMPDVYYQPEKFGLSTVFVAEEDGLSYEFNMFVVWIDQDYKLYYATDAGCSCPSPFEWATSLGKIDGPVTKRQVIDALDAWVATADDKIGLMAVLDRL